MIAPKVSRIRKDYVGLQLIKNLSIMQTIFLKDGTQANLIAKTDKGYIVDPLEIYRDYESKEEYQEPSGNVKLVDKIYEVAPVAVIQEEYKAILEKVTEQEKFLAEKRHELRDVQNEIDRLSRTKTDLQKMIINREELKKAKRLTVWVKSSIAPRIMDIKNSLKLNISYSITQWEVEEKCWAYSAWSHNDDRWSSYSEYFDEKYGVKADLTDEEILFITHERQRKTNFESYEIGRTHDKWLTPENIIIKGEYILKEKERNLVSAEKELIAIQDKITKLKTALAVS